MKDIQKSLRMTVPFPILLFLGIDLLLLLLLQISTPSISNLVNKYLIFDLGAIINLFMLMIILIVVIIIKRKGFLFNKKRTVTFSKIIGSVFFAYEIIMTLSAVTGVAMNIYKLSDKSYSSGTDTSAFAVDSTILLVFVTIIMNLNLFIIIFAFYQLSKRKVFRWDDIDKIIINF